MINIRNLPITLIAVAFSLTVHEFAHAIVSYIMGDPTAKMSGRLTLNPFKHIDWVGVICLALTGFGWAKPVPIDSYYYKDRKFGIVWTSFAGPLANFLLTFVALFIYVLLFRFAPAFAFGTIGSLLSDLLVTIAYTSAGFGVFNLIPVPPLDGSKILFAVLPDDQYYNLIRGNQILHIIFLVLIFSGLISGPLSFLRNSYIDVVYDVLIKLFGLY